MKFDIPLIKKCAFAVTLLSLSHLPGFAEEAKEVERHSNSVEMTMEQNAESLTADSFANIDADDFFAATTQSDLVAKGKHHKKRSKKRRHNAYEDVDVLTSQLPENMDENNTWVPRFVWIGDVQNSDNLKCFAAFLIGSLADQTKMGVNHQANQFNPGMFMTPGQHQKSETQLSTSLDDNYIAQKETPRQKARHKAQRKKTQARLGCPKSRFYLDFNAGASFLFFDKYDGDLVPTPAALFPAISAPGRTSIVKGSPNHNVAPLLEMDATVNIIKWLGLSFYVQSAPNHFLYSNSFNGTSAVAGQNMVYMKFQSDLALNALGGKLQFNFPNLIRFKKWCIGLFLSGGAGVAYQTWHNTQAVQMVQIANNGLTSQTLFFDPTYESNLSYNADAALSIKTRLPFPATMLKFGCKFIGWGKADGLGQPKSPDYIFGYFKPFSFDGIYSVVPYMGFTWSF